MADIIMSGGKLSYFTEAGGWQEVGGFADAKLTMVNDEPKDPIRNAVSSIVGETFTITSKFTPSPAFWGIMVGLQLQYNLRELHRCMGRMLQWPNTN